MSFRLQFYATELFSKRVTKLDAWNDVEKLKSLLDQNPEAGDLIPGAGGLRKVRMTLARTRQGKRGGGRVIYYNVSREGYVLFVFVYSKREQENLTNDEIHGLVKTRDIAVEWIKRNRSDEKGTLSKGN